MTLLLLMVILRHKNFCQIIINKLSKSFLKYFMKKKLISLIVLNNMLCKFVKEEYLKTAFNFEKIKGIYLLITTTAIGQLQILISYILANNSIAQRIY